MTLSLLVRPLGLGEQRSINPNGLAADEGRVLAGQKGYRGGDVGGGSDTAQRGQPRPGSGIVRVFGAGALGFDGSGSDAVYANAVRPQLHGGLFGEHFNSAFARRVSHQMRKRQLVASRAEVYDRASSVVFHVAGGLLG